MTLGNEEVLEGVPDVGAIEGGVNLLIVGSDSREGQGDGFGDPDEETAVLNDVTMLMHISEDHSNASVVSFPRDMLVDVPACTDPEDPTGTLVRAVRREDQHGALSTAACCVVKTVEQLTGVTIPFAGIVQFLGVAGLSEAVGGVEVCVAEPIEDEHTDLYLPAGIHTLRASRPCSSCALAMASVTAAISARISNQQVFLSSLARTLQSNGTLGDPVKLYSIAKAALATWSSPTLMDPTRMISIAKALKDTDLDKIAFIQYPTAYTEDGGAVVPTESADYSSTRTAERPARDLRPAQPTRPSSRRGDPNARRPQRSRPRSPPTEDPETAPAPTVEALPSDVTGQTAAETRCSAGRTLDDQ